MSSVRCDYCKKSMKRIFPGTDISRAICKSCAHLAVRIGGCKNKETTIGEIDVDLFREMKDNKTDD